MEENKTTKGIRDYLEKHNHLGYISSPIAIYLFMT